MYNIKYEGCPVAIEMDKKIEGELIGQGVNHLEVFRLLESFAPKLLSSRESGEMRLENEDTNATIDINITWTDDKEVEIKVVSVDLKKVRDEKLSNRPKGAKFDFNTPPESPAAEG